MFGFGKKAKEESRAKELFKEAVRVQDYFTKVSGADAVDFIESVMGAWDIAYGDDPIDNIDTDDDVKRDLKLDAAASALEMGQTSRQAGSIPRWLGNVIVAVELQAQFIPQLEAELARSLANTTIENARRKAAAMVAASGGKNDGESEANAVIRHIGVARHTGDLEKAAILMEAAAG